MSDVGTNASGTLAQTGVDASNRWLLLSAASLVAVGGILLILVAARRRAARTI